MVILHEQGFLYTQSLMALMILDDHSYLINQNFKNLWTMAHVLAILGERLGTR